MTDVVTNSLPELDAAVELVPPPRAPRPPGPDRERRLDRLVIAGPMAIGAVLSLIGIGGRSLGFDEAATVTIANQHGSALGTAIAHDGGNMSGYYLLLHVLIPIFGDGELLLRLPSAIAAVATVGLVAMIGRRLFGRRAAVASGLLCAVSLPLVFWAQNARGYAIMVAFVAAAYLALITATERRDRPVRAGWRAQVTPWAAFAVCMTLATYASFVAVLVIPAQALMLLPRDRRSRLPAFVAASVAYVAMCVPLIVLASGRGNGQLFWVPRPTREIEQQVLQSLTSAGLEPSFHGTSTTMVLMILTSLAVLVFAGWLLRRHRRGEDAWGGALVLAWLLVPVGLAFLESLVSQPIFLSRNLLQSVPAMALVLGAGLGSRHMPRRVGLGLLAVLLVTRLLQIVPAYGVSPEPWQQVSQMILNDSLPGDCIAFYPLDGRMAYQYYMARSHGLNRTPTEIMPIVPITSNQTFVERYYTLSYAQILARGASCRRLWFVSSHEGQSSGPRESREHLARYKALTARLDRAFGNARVRQYGYAAVIHVRLLPGPLRTAGHPTTPARVDNRG